MNPADGLTVFSPRKQRWYQPFTRPRSEGEYAGAFLGVGVRRAAWVLELLVLVGVGCGRGDQHGAPAPTTASADADAATPAEASDDTGDEGRNAPERVAKAAAIPIEVRDFQIFHPFSRGRWLKALEQEDKISGVGQRRTFGIGLVVDATNVTDRLLTEPHLNGKLGFHTRAGDVGCTFTEERIGWGLNHLSFDPTSKGGPWRDESRSQVESVWRPGEKIRMQVRADCGDIVVLDLGLDGATAEFTVSGIPVFTKRELTSSPTTLNVPAQTLLLDQIGLPEGGVGFVSGDSVMWLKDGKPDYNGLAFFGLRIDQVVAKGLPRETAPLDGNVEGLSYRIRDAALTRWTADPANLAKGTSRLNVVLDLALDPNAASPGDRSRISRSIRCDQLSLATNRGIVVAANARDASKACADLATAGHATAPLAYVMSRYELPIGLTFSVGGKALFATVASTKLTELDPH